MTPLPRHTPSRVVVFADPPNSDMEYLVVAWEACLEHELTFLIILDLDARRLIKRQKLSHPRFGVPHEAEASPVGSRHGVSSQHVSKVGRQQFDESRPLKRNANDDHGPGATTTTAISKKVGRGRGHVEPMMGMGSEVNSTEVRPETLPFFVLG